MVHVERHVGHEGDVPRAVRTSPAGELGECHGVDAVPYDFHVFLFRHRAWSFKKTGVVDAGAVVTVPPRLPMT